MAQTYFRTGTVVPGDLTTNQPSGTLDLQYLKTLTFPTNIIRISVTLNNLEYRVNTDASLAAKPLSWIGYNIRDGYGEGTPSYSFYIKAICLSSNSSSIFGNGGTALDNGKSIELSYSVTAVCEDPV